MITPILRVHDIDLSLRFYTQVLGFRGDGGLPGLDGKTVYAEAYLGEARIMFSPRCPRAPFAGVELYLTLPASRSIDEFYASLQAREVYICEPMHEELWGDRAFAIVDLDGNRLIFAQPMRYPACLPEPSLSQIA